MSRFEKHKYYFVGIGDQEIVLSSLAQHLRPMLLHSWQERRKAVFTDNAQRMKHLFDNLQKKLDEVWTDPVFNV